MPEPWLGDTSSAPFYFRERGRPGHIEYIRHFCYVNPTACFLLHQPGQTCTHSANGGNGHSNSGSPPHGGSHGPHVMQLQRQNPFQRSTLVYPWWDWIQEQQSTKKASDNAPQGVVQDQFEGNLPLSLGLFHGLQRSVPPSPLDGPLQFFKLTVHGSSETAFAWVLKPRSLPIVWDLPIQNAVVCAQPIMHEVDPPESNLSQVDCRSVFPPLVANVVWAVRLVCTFLLHAGTLWIDILLCCLFADHATTGQVAAPSPWVCVAILDPNIMRCGTLTHLDSHNLDIYLAPICLYMIAVGWSPENGIHVLWPKPKTSPGTIS